VRDDDLGAIDLVLVATVTAWSLLHEPMVNEVRGPTGRRDPRYWAPPDTAPSRRS
jgi:hypothetical protein